MILYFSGTGNSRYCAQMLADLLGDECKDCFTYLRNGTFATLSSQKPWVFVAPTYSWQLPRVFMEFIRGSSFSGSQDAYILMTCGNDVGSAASKNQTLLQEKGLSCHGTLPVVMPDNYLVMFSVPSREECEKMVAAARPTIKRAAALIQKGEDFPPLGGGAFGWLKSGLVNSLFNRFQIRTKPFTASNACISCGKCQTLCPLGNIHLQDGKPVWGSRCTHCMACICGCPVGVIEYGKSTRGKNRYQCPPYKASSSSQE